MKRFVPKIDWDSVEKAPLITFNQGQVIDMLMGVEELNGSSKPRAGSTIGVIQKHVAHIFNLEKR